MRKLTRRSYNRKLIMLGLALFLSVGLISTGFSAWLISSVTKADAEPPVSAGSISADSVKVEFDSSIWTEADGWIGQKIRFDAKADDTNGRVTYKADTAETTENVELVGPEQLSMKIFGKVSNADKVADLKMTITLPKTIVAAIEAGYIKLSSTNVGQTAVAAPTYTKIAEGADAGKATITITKSGDPNLNLGEKDSDGKASFEYTLTFAWGDYFANKNPSEFYDSDSTVTRDIGFGTEGDGKLVANPEKEAIKGSEINDAQLTAEMNQFHLILTGETDSTKAYEGTIAIIVEPVLN